MAIFQPDDGQKAQYLSGFAVFGGFPTLEHSTTDSVAFDAVLDNFAGDALNAALGWTNYDEHQFIAQLSQAGAFNHASDYLMNLEVLSNMPAAAARARAPQQSTEVAPSSPEVHTVAFMMSDGDNIQLLAGAWLSERWYGSPERGQVPLGWSYAAAASVLMPDVLDYVRSTMTCNDSLQAGPSGYTSPYCRCSPDGVTACLRPLHMQWLIAWQYRLTSKSLCSAWH